jgi:D-glycero-alpha-D-manno-heptose-7-phosphate kinase
MILVRSPLRITLGGGGSDLRSFSDNYGGFCISAAINKYSYVSINRSFREEIFLKYSDLEKVKLPEEIKHPIFREAIKLLDFKTPQLEIVSVADVPSTGSGLGGSGSFTVALLKALYAYRHISILPDQVAELACDINMNKLGFIQGKQDEYISALGGITCLEFNKDGTVSHFPLKISYDTLINLEENLMLFYTGISHNTNDVLQVQNNRTKENDKEIINNLLELKEIAYESKESLEKGDMLRFSILMNKQWDNKNKRNKSSNPIIEDIRKGALSNGAWGMKLIGSGNGGFLMAYANYKESLRNYMQDRGLEELRFNFDFDGVKQII